MIKTTVNIEGMMCSMCEAHISDAIRNAIPNAKKVKASHSKNEATFITEDNVDDKMLKEAIEKTGYTCVSVSSEPYKKKGIFG